ncbi:hypothetical protein [Asaia astilbis]
MKRPLLVAGLCLVVVGLGGIGVRHESRAELQRALASLRANLPPDARFEYDHAYPRFFARGAGFDNARFIKGNMTFKARVLTINNPNGYLSTGLKFSRIHAEDVSIQGPLSGTIEDLTLSKLLLPPISVDKRDVSELPPASQIHFRHGQIHGVSLNSTNGCALTLSEATLENYGHDDGNAGSLHDAHAACSPDSVLSQKLHSLTHLPAGPVVLDVKEIHETGTRYARIVAWAEQFARDPIPAETTPLRDVAETPSNAETHGLSFSLFDIRTLVETSTGRRWKQGDKMLARGESHNISITVPSSSPLAAFLPDGIHITNLTQEVSTDTKTFISTLALAAMTPKSFGFEWHASINNVENPDVAHPPALTSLELSYRDDATNIDTLLTRVAAQRNQTLPQLKEMLAIPLAFITQRAPGLSAVPEFLNTPSGHSLTISFHPPEPVDAASVKRLAPQFSKNPDLAQRWISPPTLSSSVN